MGLTTETKQWILADKPIDFPVLEGEGDKPTWVLKTNGLRALKDGEVLLQLLYLSNDPAQRHQRPSQNYSREMLTCAQDLDKSRK